MFAITDFITDFALTPEELVSLLDELQSLQMIVLRYCGQPLETHIVSWSCVCTEHTSGHILCMLHCFVCTFTG